MNDRYGRKLEEGDVIRIIGRKNPYKYDGGLFEIKAIYGTSFIEVKELDYYLHQDEIELYARPLEE